MKVREVIEIEIAATDLMEMVGKTVLQAHPGYYVEDFNFKIKRGSDAEGYPVSEFSGAALRLLRSKK